MRILVIEPSTNNFDVIKSLFAKVYKEQSIEVSNTLDFEMLKNEELECVIFNMPVDYIESLSDLYYPRIQFFASAGSDIIFGDGRSKKAIACGAGDQKCDYGIAEELEFFDDYDKNINLSPILQSSIIICAKLLIIKDYLGCTWYEARMKARNPTWNSSIGYGRIDIKKSISNSARFAYDKNVNKLIRKKLLLKVNDNFKDPQILYFGAPAAAQAGKSYKLCWDLKNLTGNVSIIIEVNTEESV